MKSMLQFNQASGMNNSKDGPVPSSSLMAGEKRRRLSVEKSPRSSKRPDTCSGYGWVFATILILVLLVALILLFVLPSSSLSILDKRSNKTVSGYGGGSKSATCVTDEILDPVTGVCTMIPHYPSAVSEAIMDTTAKPCDDFYRYACGTWMDEHTNTNRGFTALALKNTALTDAIVLNETNRALRNLFSSCVALFVNQSSSTAASKRRASSHAISESANARRIILDHILEPLKTIDDLPRVFGRLVAAGYTSPVALSIQSNPFAPGIVPAFVYDGFTGLNSGAVPWIASHFALLEPQAQNVDRARRLVAMVDDLPNPASSSSGIQESIESWHDYLAAPENKASDLIAFGQMPRLSPGWNWSHFVDEASRGTVKLSGNQSVWVNQKKRFLDKFRPEQFSVPQWRLFVEWSVLYHTHEFFPVLDEDVLFSFAKRKKHGHTKGGSWKKRGPGSPGKKGKRSGQAPAPGEEGDWDPKGVTRNDCLKVTKYMLPGQLSKKYLDAHFPVERRRLAEARVSDMVEKIKAVFQARLLKTEWMDPETRRIQAEKIGSIVARVVEPLHGHWEEEQLDMDPLRYIKNLNAVQSLRVKRNFGVWSASRYGTACDSACRDAITAFGSPLSIVNAWYNPDRNLITIPAGILQPPFYEDRYDNVSAYATIGMVIGHELSHAQDPQGSLFDKDGLLRDTWSLAARRAYEEKAQCLVREYDTDNGVDGVCSAFSGALSGEKGSYGMQTLCENTADQVGISLAFDALALTYQVIANQTFVPFVPDRDAEQFYLIFGQMWCSVYDQEAMCDRADDVHSLAHLRVRRTVAHQARFSEIHGCLIGQAMHRVERCKFF